MNQADRPQLQSHQQQSGHQESQARGRGPYRRRPHYNRTHQPRNNWYPSNSRGRGRGGHRVNQYNDRRQYDNLADENTNRVVENNITVGAEETTGPRGESDNIQSQISENELKSNSFECMICCDNIRRQQPIWSCNNCYNIFHLKCAIEWCNKSIKSRNEAMANAAYPSLGQAIGRQPLAEGPLVDHLNNDTGDSSRSTGNNMYARDRQSSVEWPCPACREILHSKPNKYKCFCGKVTRPEINRHLTPHSCGQLCGRQRPNTDCPHSCNSICHPGRCNPCPLTSRKPCFCGKVVEEVKCIVGVRSCNQICEKTLTCGRHRCTKICHDGSCSSCHETVKISCFCGDQTIERKCVDMNTTSNKKIVNGFSCTRLCNRLLDCGKHRCPERCHAGPDCSNCKLKNENIKTCPCGSTQIKRSALDKRQSCTDPIPVCGGKCNRLLPCGPDKNHHKCQRKCHNGPCPPCRLKTTLRCRCGSSNKTVDCASLYDESAPDDASLFKQLEFKPDKESFICETRCNKLKNCGRHRCQNKCCGLSKANATDTNNAQESSAHICDQSCNRKLPCGLHNCPERCHAGQCGDCTNIGWSELTCHCGGSVMYPPIPCGARPPTCHRPCRRAHTCGHPVKHECHDESEKCAPCIVFVEKRCFCKAESKDSVYCYLAGYSCGRTCKKELTCGQHHCKRVCHDGPCETPNERGVVLCAQPCPVQRYNCKHPCGLPCHGRTACKPSECRKVLEVSCECGQRTERIECFKVMRDVDIRNKVAMLSTRRADDSSEIMVDLSKVSRKPMASAATTATTAGGSGRPSDQLNLKRLDCDDTCALLKRNKALAEALDIEQADLRPMMGAFGEDPLRLLREATARDYKFVAATYNSLAKFVKAAKESERRFIFMQCAPADKFRRELVHELAHHFGCTSESQDEEPFRHVVVRAYKNKSCVPDFSVEQLLPIADGE